MNKHIIYLAAGNSSRFGANKLLQSFHGKELFRHGMDMLSSLCRRREDCSLTVISRYPEILRQARERQIRAVCSPDSGRGMSFTIKAAIRALGNVPGEDFLIFVTADQPYLREETVERLAELAGKEVWTASVTAKGSPGSPVMFSARLIPELLRLRGDEGGRKITGKYPCVWIDVEDEKELRDIDRPEHLGI